MTGLPAEQARKLPRTPVLPAALIGRLAVDRRINSWIVSIENRALPFQYSPIKLQLSDVKRRL
jgi:hypothetical protein